MKVGILGGGQLARMLALAGYPLGLQFVVLDPSAGACATQVADLIQANYDDQAALQELAAQVDVVTFEFENVPSESLKYLQENCPVFPPPIALHMAQDRLNEKNMFSRLDIPVPAFVAIDTRQQLEQAVEQIGLPSVLKTRSMGYDGKGQIVLKTQHEIDSAWEQLGGRPLIIESMVAFDREVSMIAVRNREAEIVFYPLSENTHHQGILHYAQSRPDDSAQSRAQDYIKRILDELNYVGVLALELFDVNGELLANEIAPRVHNSGHWTIEGAELRQFENHLRAVLNLPLGSTRPVGFAAMVNFIGTMPDKATVLDNSMVHLHDYHKAPRPGRKIGHATLKSETPSQLSAELEKLINVAAITKV
jgi:5-(carboxyamino)imidazole ribonucleotide synthase